MCNLVRIGMCPNCGAYSKNDENKNDKYKSFYTMKIPNNFYKFKKMMSYKNDKYKLWWGEEEGERERLVDRRFDLS